MTDHEYKPGKLWGEDRDRSYELKSVHGVDDETLGKLCRAMGRLAAGYREKERQKALPHHMRLDSDAAVDSDDKFGKRQEDYRRFSSRMKLVDEVVNEQLFKVVERSLIDPKKFAMISTTVLLKDSEPVLYYEHWGTDDLDDPAMDSVEVQAFMSFDGFVQTEEGAYVAFQVLDNLFECYSMSEKGIPGDMETFGSAPKEVFEPMKISGWSRPRFGC